MAGRAGRAAAGGNVIVQTLHPDEPAIVKALKHDVDGFSQMELPNRQQVHLPPYWRLVRLVIRHERSDRVEEAAMKLAGKLAEIFPAEAHIKMYGPAVAPVARIKRNFRWHMLLSCPTAGTIQKYLGPQIDNLVRQIPAELIADVDPTSLA